MKTLKASWATGVVFGLTLTAGASADTVNARFTSSLGQAVSITSPVRNGNVNTVQFSWTRQDVAGAGVDSSIGTNFSTYCVDLAQVVSPNTGYVFNVVTPAAHGFSPLQTTLLQRIWADYFPLIDTADESAAFQISIWEIVHDSSLNLSSGSFKTTNAPAAVAIASTWLGSVSAVSYTSSNPLPQLAVLESSTAQDQLTVVPAPATGALAGMGLLAVASRRRRA